MSVMKFTSGLPETPCGAGSTVSYTERIRSVLPNVMRSIGVSTLLDAPCGDFNWMARTDLSNVHYVGVDINKDHCIAASAKESNPHHYAPRSKTIMLLDVCQEIPLEADMMLCRDFLQHLPNERVAVVLKNFVDSGIFWFLCTSHGSSENVDIEMDGQFRPLNLLLSPFGLPDPYFMIDDGPNRILGLWRRDQIA